MSLDRLSPVRRVALFSATILLGSGVAFAQASSPHDSSYQVASLSSYSSSSEGMPDLAAAPDPAPKPGGQYDNRSGNHSNGWLNRSRWTFEAGGGFNAPTSDSSPYIGWGGNFQVGGGVRVNPRISVLAEYQFFRNGLPDRIVAQTGATGGNAHIWSLTLNPIIDLFPKNNNTVYVTGGGGFYRKVTNFTDPQAVQYCDYFYYYCGVGYQNAVVGHFSSNQGGFSVGAGFAHRFGGMYGEGHTQVFAEARYMWIDTPAVIGQSANGLNPTTIGSGTELIPVTFGIRF